MTLVETAVTEAVATLTLNRPEARNALSVQLCEDIVVALHGLDLDPEPRAVVIRGKGAAFCSGADLAAVSDADLDFLTVCDFRVATSDATLGTPSSKLGILVNFENVQRLVLLAGIAVAKEVLMTGRTYSGDEAAGLGLVNRAVATESLDEEASVLGQELAALAPLSIQGVKRSIQAIPIISAERGRAIRKLWPRSTGSSPAPTRATTSGRAFEPCPTNAARASRAADPS